jgi:hypothetical protein
MQNANSLLGSKLTQTAARPLGGKLNFFFALLFFIVSPAAVSASFSIDTFNTAMTGLWGNQNESGWGTAITQEYGMMFVTLYTYDAKR